MSLFFLRLITLNKQFLPDAACASRCKSIMGVEGTSSECIFCLAFVFFVLVNLMIESLFFQRIASSSKQQELGQLSPSAPRLI